MKSPKGPGQRFHRVAVREQVQLVPERLPGGEHQTRGAFEISRTAPPVSASGVVSTQPVTTAARPWLELSHADVGLAAGQQARQHRLDAREQV